MDIFFGREIAFSDRVTLFCVLHFCACESLRGANELHLYCLATTQHIDCNLVEVSESSHSMEGLSELGLCNAAVTEFKD